MTEKPMSKEYCLELSGDFACFTRPELKVERVSYDVITPSAARNIFQAILWKPAIRWEVSRIEVRKPIRHISVKRNEVGALARPGGKEILIEEARQQRTSYILKDVEYRIFARQVFIPVSDRSEEERRDFESRSEAEKQSECPGKYQGMFERRASKGQCFSMPYLGCREFSCHFSYIPDAPHSEGIDETRDLGLMLYDMDFESNPKSPESMFFRARMDHGVIEVPEPNSEEILR